MHPFDAMVQREGEIRLAEAALLLAADYCPGLEPGLWLSRLDGLAARVHRLGAQTPMEQVAALQLVLVDEEGFRGNTDDYYDPRNSLLNEVLDRRLGIPITLCTIWLDVTDRLGWPFSGVGLPGHFIIKNMTAGDETLIDPFGGGLIVSRADCATFVTRLYGPEIRLTEESFAATPARATLTRMLNNLYSIFSNRQAWRNAACAAERMLALEPDSAEVRRQWVHARASQAKLN